MVKISVVVPVYNVYDYLDKCLKSIVKQSFKDFEVIVVNDGSPDKSQKIIDSYVKKYPKLIRAYTKKNGGLSSARNYGINKAKGEFTICIDSDDYIKKDMLKDMYNKAVKEDLDIVVSDTIIKYDDSEYIVKSNNGYSDDVIKNYLITVPMATIRFVRTEIYKAMQFRVGVLYEDLDLTPSFVLKTNKIGFMEEAYYYYYQRQGSIMKATSFSTKFLDIFGVIENLENKFKEANKYEEYRDEMEYLNITHLLRTATLRFMDYEDAKSYLKKVNDIIKNNYPNFRKNKYFKQSSKKFQLICILAYNKNYRILKLIKKLTNK